MFRNGFEPSDGESQEKGEKQMNMMYLHFTIIHSFDFILFQQQSTDDQCMW